MARVGAIRLRQKSNVKKCPICPAEVEDIEHFLWFCMPLALNHDGPEFNDLDHGCTEPNLDRYDVLGKWLMAQCRSTAERNQISDVIRRKWTLRGRIMKRQLPREIVQDPDPQGLVNGTEDDLEQEPLDRGNITETESVENS